MKLKLSSKRLPLTKIMMGSAATDVLLAGDANGDGRKDLILFARTEGKVYVALSTGQSFAPPTVWHPFFAVSTYERPRVGDFNGDGRADIITFATDSPTARGDVYAAMSTGSSFGASSAKWHDWFSVDPAQLLGIGDFDGDGKDDMATFMPPPSGQVYVVYSQGVGMSQNVEYAKDVAGDSMDVPFVGDPNGDGKADVVVFAQRQGKVFINATK